MRSRSVVALYGLAGIPGIALQVAAARDRLSEGTETVTRELETLLAGAANGDQRARHASLPCAIALAQDDGAEHVVRLAGHAERLGLPLARLVLRSAAPHRVMSRHGRLTDWHASMTRLGRRPQWVERDGVEHVHWIRSRVEPSTRIWVSMDRLLVDPDPERVKQLLAWEGLRPEEAQHIAARRPTTPAIIRVLCSDLRWIAQHDVREALVLNPFVPAGIALKLLPTVSTPRHRLRRAPLHPLLLELAARLASSGSQLVDHHAQRLHGRLGEADGPRG